MEGPWIHGLSMSMADSLGCAMQLLKKGNMGSVEVEIYACAGIHCMTIDGPSSTFVAYCSRAPRWRRSCPDDRARNRLGRSQISEESHFHTRFASSHLFEMRFYFRIFGGFALAGPDEGFAWISIQLEKSIGVSICLCWLNGFADRFGQCNWTRHFTFSLVKKPEFRIRSSSA
jgi:hypothetical protein